MKSTSKEMREAQEEYLANKQKELIQHLYVLEVSKSVLNGEPEPFHHVLAERLLKTVKDTLNEQ